MRTTRRAVLVTFSAAVSLATAGCGGPLLAMPAPPATPPPAASVPAERVAVVPVSELRHSDASGTVRRVIDHGRLVVDTTVGALMIPVGESCSGALVVGRSVRVRTAVQEVARIEVPAGVETRSPLVMPLVAHSPSTYSTLIGDLLGVTGDGRLIVDTPTGPITLWLPPAAWQLGRPVQVWTWIDPGQQCGADR